MSALNNLLGQQDDPRKIELIRSLIDKTRQGRIPWAKRANALTAAVPSGVEVNFVLSPTILTPYSSWQLLTVRDKSGSELIRVDSASGVVSILAGGRVKNALTEAADELFGVVNAAAGDDLDRAIDRIKKL